MASRPALCWAVLAAWATLAHASGTSAQPAPGKSSTEDPPGTGPDDSGEDDRPVNLKARMLEILSEGTRLASEADWEGALAKYREAHETLPNPLLLLNIGTALRMLGRNADAAAEYERYIHHEDAHPERVEELQRHIKEIDELVGHVTVEVMDRDATVRIDGKQLVEKAQERQVLTFRVDPGDHTLVAQKDGKHPDIVNFSVERRERVGVVLELVDVAEDKPEPREYVPDEGDSQRAAGLAIAAFGVVSVGVGVIFGVMASSKNDEAALNCEDDVCDGEGQALGDTALTFSHVSTVGFVVGALATVGGLSLYYTAPEPPILDHAGVVDTTIAVGPRGVTWRGRF